MSYTDRIDELGVSASIGTVGDSYDNAMAESVMGIFKTELHRNQAVLADNGGHWKGLDDLEIATCAWVSWFNEERLHSELGDRTPLELEAEGSAVRRVDGGCGEGLSGGERPGAAEPGDAGTVPRASRPNLKIPTPKRPSPNHMTIVAIALG